MSNNHPPGAVAGRWGDPPDEPPFFARRMTRVFHPEVWEFARKHLPNAVGKWPGFLGMSARCGVTDCEVVDPLGNVARNDTVLLPEIAVCLVGKDDFTLFVEHRDVR